MAHQLEDLKSGCNLYGWEKVRAFHRDLHNQLEQGYYPTHTLTDHILKFYRALVWHSPSPPSVPSSAQPALSYTSSGPLRYHKTAKEYNASARPGEADFCYKYNPRTPWLLLLCETQIHSITMATSYMNTLLFKWNDSNILVYIVKNQNTLMLIIHNWILEHCTYLFSLSIFILC